MTMEAEEGVGRIPEWVVTFGDMMSLLLTFFIMLVSLSEIKEAERYQALVESMTRRFGYDSSVHSMAPGKVKPRNAMIADLATAGRAKRVDVMRGGDRVQAPAGEHPHVRLIRPGEKTNIGTVVYFDEGSATLSPPAQAALRAVAASMQGKPQKIEVRGHTSYRPLPANAQFKNHMELGFGRAMAVREFLIRQCGIDSGRIRCTSAGAAEPKTISADLEAQRENPRAEVFLLNEVVTDLEGTPAEQARRYSVDPEPAPAP